MRSHHHVESQMRPGSIIEDVAKLMRNQDKTRGDEIGSSEGRTARRRDRRFRID